MPFTSIYENTFVVICNVKGFYFLSLSPTPTGENFSINKVTCYANKWCLICFIPSYSYRIFYYLKEDDLLHSVQNNIFCVSYFNKKPASTINTYQNVSYLFTLVLKCLKAWYIFYETLYKMGPYSYV